MITVGGGPDPTPVPGAPRDILGTMKGGRRVKVNAGSLRPSTALAAFQRGCFSGPTPWGCGQVGPGHVNLNGGIHGHD